MFFKTITQQITPISLTWLLSFSLPIASSQAQVIPDSTLGAEGSQVNVIDEFNQQIDGGARREGNLFHSFTEFNVNQGRGVYFANPQGVINIFSRVTGSNASLIFGKLGVLGESNLFLLNPNGIIFGPNASLDLRGSFVATTADSIIFENGYQFSASNPTAPPLLTINVPIGLGLSKPEAAISNQGNLTVGSQKTLILYGGEVRHSGEIIAPGGTVQILGSHIALVDNGSIDVSSETGGGNVLIGGSFQGQGFFPRSLRTYVGHDVTINADAIINGDGGNVVIWADEITGFYGNISARGGNISGNGGLVEVSGQKYLIYRGNVDASAINGQPGTLLLDPENILIKSGTGDGSNDGTNGFAGNNSGTEGQVLSTPLNTINDTQPTTIYESELEGLSGNTNVILQATNNITVEALENSKLTFAAGSGTIQFIADADGDMSGNFVMEDTTDTIATNGRNILISGANVTVGNIETAGSLTDAGDLPNTARVVGSEPGVPLQIISGSLSSSLDVDLFQIYLTGGGTFSATTIDSTVDSQLFLFDADGIGIYGNDDTAGCDCYQSTLPSGHPLTPTAPGIYFLGVSSYGVEPISNNPENGQLGFIFTDPFLNLGVGFEDINTPTNSGGAFPLNGWRRITFGNSGSYTIKLTGAEGIVANFSEAVPPNSGSINLSATASNGDINAGNLNTSANSLSRDAGNGGDVILSAGRNITITGNLNTSSTTGSRFSAGGDAGNAGDIILTAGGDIGLQNINTTTIAFSNNVGNGGTVSISADGSISTGTIETFTRGRFQVGNAGTVTISAISGDINTEIIDTYSNSSFQNSGNAGAINLTSGGDINTSNIDTQTFGRNNAGDAGDITLRAEGNVTAGNILINPDERPGIDARSFSNQGIAGKGGNIEILAKTGDINVVDLSSSSHTQQGMGNNGGNMTLVAGGTVQTRDIDAQADDGGNGGNVSITATTGDITTRNIEAHAEGVLENAGNGGSITLNASGNVQAALIFSYSSANQDGINAGNGGDIQISAGGNLTSSLSIQSYANSFGGNGGNGGDIILNVGGDVAATNLNAFALSQQGTAGDGGKIEVNTGGDINVNTVNSFAFAPQKAGKGNEIILTTRGEKITDIDINTFAISESAEAGNGGNILLNLNNQGQNTIDNTELLTFSSTSKSGVATINSQPNLTIDNLSIITSKQVEVEFNIGQSIEKVILTVGGVGESGEVIISTQGNLNLSNSSILADTKGIDSAGNVNVTSVGTITLNNTSINSQTTGEGQAGSIIIQSPQAVTITGENSSIITETNSNGNAGNITFNTPILNLNEGVTVSARTSGNGNSGTITIEDAQIVTLDNNSNLTVETSGAGKAGNIIITSNTVTIGKDAQLSATATETSTNTEGGGSISLNTSNLNISGQLGIFAETQGQAPAGNLTINSHNNNPNLNIRFTDNGFISARTTASGQGGNINFNASDTINIQGEGKITAETTGVGNAGNIQFNSPNLNIAEGVEVSATTSGGGNAGNIVINAPKSLNIEQNSRITVETTNLGDAGNINVTTSNLTIGENAELSARTREQATGKAGNITLNANQLDISGELGIFAETEGIANAGNLNIKPYNSPNLDIIFTQEGNISASTQGSGDGGNIDINAPANININGDGNIKVETNGSGNAGNINITSQNLQIGNGVQITASTTAEGDAGSIQLNSPQKISINNGIISSSVESEGEGNAGEINLNTNDLSLTNNSQIRAETNGRGNAGNINIVNADTVSLNNSQISTAIQPQGQANTPSNINITANSLELNNDSEITASTLGTGNAGDINLDVQQLNLQQANITSLTNGRGNAGKINIPNADTVSLNNSQISTAIQPQGQANIPSNITINASNLNLNNNSAIQTNSQGSGNAGDITIKVGNSIESNNSNISTEASQTSGGNINITAQKIRLRGDSDIQTNVNSGAGGGGDINLTADSILLFDDSDILAFARDGQGGNIQLNTPVFFGNGYQPSSPEIDPNILDGNNQVNLNASGAVSGVIIIPDLTFIQNSLVQLPDFLINPETLIANSCVVLNRAAAGNFVITGAGGLPPRPGDPSIASYPTGTVHTLTTYQEQKPWQIGDPMLEPQGVYRSSDGKLLLSRPCE